MEGDIKDRVKKACQLYYLAVKNEDKISKEFVSIAKNICNDAIKIAKTNKIELDEGELIETILK